jgi:hypothetical protein
MYYDKLCSEVSVVLYGKKRRYSFNKEQNNDQRVGTIQGRRLKSLLPDDRLKAK